MTDDIGNSTAVEVVLYDNGVSLGPVTMTSTTTWTKQVSNLSSARHQFTAGGSGSISTAWPITVSPSVSEFEDFESYADDPAIPVGQSLSTKAMKITNMGGGNELNPVRISIQPFPTPGKLEGRVLSVAGTTSSNGSTIRLDLHKTYSSVAFFIGGYAHVSYYNAQGLLGNDSYSGDYEVICSGDNVSRIDIISHNSMTRADNFRFYV